MADCRGAHEMVVRPGGLLYIGMGRRILWFAGDNMEDPARNPCREALVNERNVESTGRLPGSEMGLECMDLQEDSALERLEFRGGFAYLIGSRREISRGVGGHPLLRKQRLFPNLVQRERDGHYNREDAG